MDATVARLHAQALDRFIRGALPSPPLVWQFHTKQNEAFRHYDRLSDRVQKCTGVFSHEIKEDGRREYLVATYRDFCSRYVDPAVMSGERHYYEVIREGHPCWLYFDIDAKWCQLPPDVNRSTYTKGLLDSFYLLLRHFLFSNYGVKIEEKDVIDMDSSTTDKLSRHIIIKHQAHSQRRGTTSTAFASNAMAGWVVQQFVEWATRLRDEAAADQQAGRGADVEPFGDDAPSASTLAGAARALFVRSKVWLENPDGCEEGREWECVVDRGVYSRNRCFRMLHSSKYGKDTALKLDMDRTGYPMKHLNTFRVLESLASFVPSTVILFEHPDVPHMSSQEYLRSCRQLSAPQPSRQAASSCVEGSDGDIPEVHRGLIDYMVASWDKEFEAWRGSPATWRQSRLDLLLQPPQPPEPPDTFSTDGTGVRSRVAKWWFTRPDAGAVYEDSADDRSLSDSTGYVCVSLGGDNRLCERIGRPHKSNGIMLVADLRRRVFWQKCFDVDCSGFRSIENGLPDSLFADATPGSGPPPQKRSRIETP
ncbi:unnamed protein product [Vitrella brassicaformis CCMP3155]|uniref:DNA-directed primase/polymerase protein n=2 Tax=Vitrella brassicaformis TaxID=1169539 RepID=A0A0G4EBF4_VITBC|nr:unnamed protein product [Vitrella brassicaformis CCMP3155]|eukprot:CEL93293.1 unnamed protein product [Vitrella brassicaformis CCMP3155]